LGNIYDEVYILGTNKVLIDVGLDPVLQEAWLSVEEQFRPVVVNA
jgi:hypothetical protein